jgi:hypothetical protein
MLLYKGAITPQLTRSHPNFVTAEQRRRMTENPSPDWSLRTRSRSYDFQIIENNNIKRGYKLNQTLRNPIEMVFPVVEHDFVENWDQNADY